jgi:hypothetical protein
MDRIILRYLRTMLMINNILLSTFEYVYKDIYSPFIFNLGYTLPSLTISTFVYSMAIPTVAIMLVQTIPNTVPWGVLSAHLHDFLATDEKLSMQVIPDTGVRM